MDRNSRNDRQETGTTGFPGSNNMKGRRQEHPGTLFNIVASSYPSRDRGMWIYKNLGGRYRKNPLQPCSQFHK
jgi:hypothetical protein